MLTKISQRNIVKLRKFITNPVIDSELVLTKKKSIKCVEGNCDDCMFKPNGNDIEHILRNQLYIFGIGCSKAKCISLANNYILVEK